MADPLRTKVTEEALDPGALLTGFTARLPGDAGAVVTFLGLARDVGVTGECLDALTLEAHPSATARSLETIARETFDRFELLAVEVVHRHGAILPAEPIVWVAVAAAHRRAAFDAAVLLMDRLKTEAVLWKREDHEAEARWIEPTPADYEAAARWERE